VQGLLSGQLLLAAVVTGLLYALVALGLNLIYGTMRLLNVAHGELVMLGGYAVFWLFTLWGVPPPVGAVVAVVLGAALGWAAYRGIFRAAIGSTRALEQLEANSLLLFFGLSIIVQNAATLAFAGDLRGYRYLDGVIEVGGLAIAGNRLYVFVAAVLACLGTAVLLRASTLGLSVRALIQNRDAAMLVGIDVDRVQLASFCLGFAMAALAGALISSIEHISPFMGFPFTIAAFVVIILGGLGNLAGSLVGGLVLGVLETYGVALTAPTYQSILIYGVFILVLLWRPQGLFGGKGRAR
jgi:branched-chain amino acid transport system permease protein